MQLSLIIQIVLTIALENGEFVEEVLGKLRYSSFTILLLNNARKHFKAIGNTYTNLCRLYFEPLHETTEKYVKGLPPKELLLPFDKTYSVVQQYTGYHSHINKAATFL